MDRLKHLALLVAFVLVAAACEDTGGATTTHSIVTDSTAPPTATTAVVTTTAVQPTSSPTSTSDSAVGTREALVALMEPTVIAVEALYAIESGDVPVPDIHGEPASSLRELLLQEFWVYSHAPLESWAGVLAQENSPDWDVLRSFYNSVGFSVATFDATDEDPYEILEARLASDDEQSEVSRQVLDEAGDGSVVVFFRSSLQPHTLVDAEESALTQTREGWSDRASLAVIVPTEVGWQFFWSESQ